jgi:integrase
LTIVQTRELRLAEWSEFDFNKNVWTIPAEKMKMPWPHIVPLSTQALAILEELRPFTGQGRYLFSNPLKETRPISDFTLLKALGSMGFSKNEMVVEGFRSIARNKLMEMGYSLDWINLQLTQAPGGVWESYNYAAFLPERRKMMQHWADYLDSLKLGENI